MTATEIKTYPEMNWKIIGHLEFQGSSYCLYAAARILELEKENENLKTLLEIEKLEKEVYYNRLVISDRGNISVNISIGEVEKRLELIENVIQKIGELEKHLKNNPPAQVSR